MAIIEAIDQMHIFRTATSSTDGKRPAKMCFGPGCESGDLLVPDRNPVNKFMFTYRFGESVQRVTHYTVNAFDPAEASVLRINSAMLVFLSFEQMIYIQTH